MPDTTTPKHLEISKFVDADNTLNNSKLVGQISYNGIIKRGDTFEITYIHRGEEIDIAAIEITFIKAQH